MADKKVKYTHYNTEWDKASSDEKHQDKNYIYPKSNYKNNSRNNNNKYTLIKTLLKKYKYKAKRAFDENELKELFKNANYNEEQINKEIEYKLKEINEKGFEFGWHKVKKGKKHKPVEQAYNPSHTHENFNKGLKKETYKEYSYDTGNLNTISYRTGYKDKFYKSGGNWSKREIQGNNSYNYFHKDPKTQRRPFMKAFEVPSDPNYNWGENIKIAIERNKKDIEEEKEEKKKQNIIENEERNENECDNKESNIINKTNDDNNEVFMANKDKPPISRNEKYNIISHNKDDSSHQNVNLDSTENKKIETINSQQQQQEQEQVYEDNNNNNNNNNVILHQNENYQMHSKYNNDIKQNEEESEDEEEEEEDDEEEEEDDDDDNELGINSSNNENMSPEKKNLLRKYYLEKLKVYSSQKNTKNKKPSLSRLSEQTSFYTIKSLSNALFLSIIVEERNHKGGVINEYVFPFTLDDLKEKDIIFSKCNSIEEAQKVIAPLLKGKMSFNKDFDYIDLYLIVLDKNEERKILFRLFPQVKDGGMFNQFQKILLKLNSKVLQYEDEIKSLKEILSKKK